jgi:hypothetical protein
LISLDMNPIRGSYKLQLTTQKNLSNIRQSQNVVKKCKVLPGSFKYKSHAIAIIKIIIAN